MRRMFSQNQIVDLIKNVVKESSTEVLEAIKDHDINVEGITSKGIANTGGLANIGDVAISGDLSVSGNTTVGDLSLNSGKVAKIFENIVDKDGHKRFIEGDITPEEITGLTYTYAKWSLSGTHLMIVLSGNIVNAATVAGVLANISLPEWVTNKIIPTSGILVEYKVVPIFDSALTDSQNMVFNLSKDTGVFVRCNQIITTRARNFRIAFDLLIDNEEQE